MMLFNAEHSTRQFSGQYDIEATQESLVQSPTSEEEVMNRQQSNSMLATLATWLAVVMIETLASQSLRG